MVRSASPPSLGDLEPTVRFGISQLRLNIPNACERAPGGAFVVTWALLEQAPKTMSSAKSIVSCWRWSRRTVMTRTKCGSHCLRPAGPLALAMTTRPSCPAASLGGGRQAWARPTLAIGFLG